MTRRFHALLTSRKCLLLCALCCVLWATAAANAADVAKKQYLQIVLLGDSVTWSARAPYGRRYADCLETAVQKRCGADWVVDVAACGAGGNTAEQGFARLQQDCIAYDPDIVVINFGANDSFRGFTPASFEKVYGKLVDTVGRETKARIVLETIPTICQKRHPKRDHELAIKHGGLENYIELFHAVIRATAKANGLPLHDRFAIFHERLAKDASVNELLIRGDGVHFTLAGNELFGQSLADIIVPLIPKDRSRAGQNAAAWLKKAEANSALQECRAALEAGTLGKLLTQRTTPRRLLLQQCRSFARRAATIAGSSTLAQRALATERLAAGLLALQRTRVPYCRAADCRKASAAWGLSQLDGVEATTPMKTLADDLRAVE